MRRVPELDLVMGPHHANRCAAAMKLPSQSCFASFWSSISIVSCLCGRSILASSHKSSSCIHCVNSCWAILYFFEFLGFIMQDRSAFGASGSGKPSGGNRPHPDHRGHCCPTARQRHHCLGETSPACSLTNSWSYFHFLDARTEPSMVRRIVEAAVDAGECNTWLQREVYILCSAKYKERGAEQDA